MHAVAFQAPYEVAVVEKPDPELQAPDDAIVRISATGVCGSDLHIFHGRVQIEPGFTIGHEYVGEVVAAGGGGTSRAVPGRRPRALPLAPRPRSFFPPPRYPQHYTGRR